MYQHASPGADIESNWSPAPAPSVSNTFNIVLRTYLPGEEVLNGTSSSNAHRIDGSKR